jgi:hypothetical protein
MSTRTINDPGSADLFEGMHARSFPRTLSDGTPRVVASSTSGSASPILRTVLKFTLAFRMSQAEISRRHHTLDFQTFLIFIEFLLCIAPSHPEQRQQLLHSLEVTARW